MDLTLVDIATSEARSDDESEPEGRTERALEFIEGALRLSVAKEVGRPYLMSEYKYLREDFA